MTNNIIVNFFGGPGAGKTTAAADLFSSLKKNHVEAQLVGEFATECVLEGNQEALEDQVYIFGNTYHRMVSAHKSAPVTVIDSPILLSLIYQTGLPESFNDLIIEMHNRLDNFNVMLDVRDEAHNHSMVGRVHSLSESVGLDHQIKTMLDLHSIPYVLQSDVESSGKKLIPYLTNEILDYLNEATAAAAE